MTRSQSAASPTVATLFPVVGAQELNVSGAGQSSDPSTSQRKAFNDRLAREIKGVKTASMPDLAPKIAELFDIPLPAVLISSWKKATEIQALLYKSKNSPDEIFFAGLTEHTINS